MQGAYLIETNLNGANLSKAVMFRAKYDQDTAWPEGFNPTKAGAVEEKYAIYTQE
jgi:hypothetical protein